MAKVLNSTLNIIPITNYTDFVPTGHISETSLPVGLNECVDAVVQNETRLHKSAFPVKITNNSFLTVLELFTGKNSIQFRRSAEVDEEFHLIYQPKPIEGSMKPNFILKPLLIVAKDEDIPPINDVSILTRISIGLELIQVFFSEKLHEADLGRGSFNLGVGQVFQADFTKEDLLEMNTNQVWEMLGRQIMADEGIWDEETKYAAFLVHPWKDLINSSGQHSALGGGGLVLLHSDFVEIWPDSVQRILPQLDNRTKAELGTCKTLLSFHESVILTSTNYN